jgi:hypothetical protein
VTNKGLFVLFTTTKKKEFYCGWLDWDWSIISVYIMKFIHKRHGAAAAAVEA